MRRLGGVLGNAIIFLGLSLLLFFAMMALVLALVDFDLPMEAAIPIGALCLGALGILAARRSPF